MLNEFNFKCRSQLTKFMKSLKLRGKKETIKHVQIIFNSMRMLKICNKNNIKIISRSFKEPLRNPCFYFENFLPILGNSEKYENRICY